MWSPSRRMPDSFLDQMAKPEIESIEGLSPTIAIDQRSAGRNPRSTVGTATEIYDYLRLLFARVGEPHCHVCGKPITTMTIDQMVDRVMEFPGQGAVQRFWRRWRAARRGI